jgi:hypothetical protein
MDFNEFLNFTRFSGVPCAFTPTSEKIALIQFVELLGGDHPAEHLLSESNSGRSTAS